MNKSIDTKFNIISKKIASAFLVDEKCGEILSKIIAHYGGLKSLQSVSSYSLNCFYRGGTSIRCKIYFSTQEVFIEESKRGRVALHYDGKSSQINIQEGDREFLPFEKIESYSCWSKIMLDLKPFYIFPLAYFWENRVRLKYLGEVKLRDRKCLQIECSDEFSKQVMVIDKKTNKALALHRLSHLPGRSKEYRFLRFRKLRNLLLPAATELYAGKKKIGKIVLEDIVLA